MEHSLLTSIIEKRLESVIRKGLKSSGTRCISISPSIPLREREEQLKEFVEIVRNNMEQIYSPVPDRDSTNTAKTNLEIPTITGGAGIGKVVMKHWFMSLD